MQKEVDTRIINTALSHISHQQSTISSALFQQTSPRNTKHIYF